jgi:Beta-propeller repeat
MRWLGLVLCAALAVLVGGAAIDQGTTRSAAEPTSALAFVPNAGQTEPTVHFSAHASGASFYFTQKEAVLAFSRGDEGLALRLGFVGANPNPKIEGGRARAGTVNYLVGSDSSKWTTGIPTFGEVVYRELWPGIDMVFRGANGTLKYEFVVRPGADPSDIGLAYRSAESLSVGAGGVLLIGTPWGTLHDEKPRSFQMVDGRRVPVESGFALSESGGAYGFALGAYDPSRPLVIDPGLVYSTYLGSSGFDEVDGVALGDDGSAYVVGLAGGADFPTTAGAYDPSLNDSPDAFVTKLDASGALVYSTFIGGSSTDSAASVVLDASRNPVVAGSTNSNDFPTTADALDDAIGGTESFSDVFVARLSADGSQLVYSTYLGGPSADVARDIALDGAGSAYVVGLTRDGGFPTTAGAYDDAASGQADGFLAKLDPTGSALAYSTYLGGIECDFESVEAVEVDADGNAYVTGMTSAGDFPTTPGAFDETPEGCSPDLNLDAFVTKVNANGSGLVYSTALAGDAGKREFGFGITIDDGGRATVAGGTASPEFPTTLGAFDTTFGGNVDAFVTQVDAAGGDLVFSTFLGGFDGDDATAVALDDAGDVYVTGLTDSPDFPVTPGAFDESVNDSEDAFLVRLNSVGTEVVYGTFLGGAGTPQGADAALFGLDVDSAGNALFGGYTESASFPTSPGALDTSYGGGQQDGWVAKLATDAAPPDSDGDGIPDEQDIEPIRDRIDALIAADPESRAADKLEDSLAKVENAIAKLGAGDRQGALGEVEGAVGDIAAAVNARDLDATVGTALMRDIAAFARIIATQAIDAAKARNGDARKIAEAEAALAQGDARAAAPRNRFKDAIGKYKDAVAKAESA